jgi:hypothetical protein
VLWTDSIFINQADLATIDPDVNVVSNAESITIDGPQGVAHRAIEKCAMFVLSRNMNFSGFLSGSNLSSSHVQAVLNVGLPAVERARVLLQNIVINGTNPYSWSPLKDWVVYRTLADFYEIASNRNWEVDRYSRKRDSFAKAARWNYWPLFQDSGLPVLYKPLSAPGGFFMHNAGSWQANVVNVTGTAGGVYDVAITYVDQSLYTNQASRNNGESHPSDKQSVSTNAGEGIQVDITNLNPPNGNGEVEDVAVAIITPLNATGWNIWVSVNGQNAFYLQNASPIPIATKTYTLPADPVSTGYLVGMGQYRDQQISMQDLRKRG